MVRFIMRKSFLFIIIAKRIYIPIWLDLLSIANNLLKPAFSIYIPIWLDLLLQQFSCIYWLHAYLHSNMVRFIIKFLSSLVNFLYLFTFQYGQIYYQTYQSIIIRIIEIYIPIWLDLLLNIYVLESMAQDNLHSNMVRFIIYKI